MKLFGQISELSKVIWRKATGYSVTLEPTNATVGDATVSIPDPAGSARELVTTNHSQSLTNKTIDADLNTISNIDNADIKAGAAIDASKIANGSVSNTEFQYLDGVTSSIQTQLNNSSTALSDHLSDTSDAHDASAISVVPTGNLGSSDVQAALVELQGDADSLQTQVSSKVGTIGALDSQTKSANGAVITSGSLVLQTADASNPGLVSTGTQTIAGAKTFSGALTASSGVQLPAGQGVESSSSGALNLGTGSNTTALNIGTGSTTQTVNIGTGAGTTTINIGASGDTVNIAGTLSYVNTTDLQVTDKLITLNKGGAAASGTAAGVEVEENGSATGYARVDSTRAGWEFKGPASAAPVNLTGGVVTATISAAGLSTSAKTFTLPNVSGTFVTTGDTGSVTSTMIADNTIMDGDINASAAITRSKLASGTADHVIINNGSGVLSSEAQLATSRGGTGVNSTATFPTSGVVVTRDATETLTNKTITNPLVQRVRMADAQVSTAGPALALQATVTTYRLQTGFGTSLSAITGGNDGDFIVIVNEHGTSDITVVNSASLYTGTNANLILKQNAAITITYDATGTKWNIVGGAGAGGLTPSSQNGNFTAQAGFNYLVDTSAAAVTVTLPSGAAGSVIRFTDAEETWGNASRALTLTPASGQKIGQQAANETLVMDVSGSWVELTWDSVNSWWTVAGPAPGSNTAILDGGNTLGKSLLIGTNDNFGVDIETNGTTKLSVGTAGNISANTATTSHSLRITSQDSVVRLRGTEATASTGRTTRLQFEDYNAAIGDAMIQYQLPDATLSGSSFIVGIGTRNQIHISGTSTAGANAFQFATGNTSSGLQWTPTGVIGSATVAGAWTLGPTSGGGPHLIRSAEGTSHRIHNAAVAGTGTLQITKQIASQASNQYIEFRHTASTTGIGTFDGGIISNTGSPAFNTSSDKRLKTNITNLETSLNKILNLIPKNFEYVDRPGIVKSGFIAQDVLEIFPKFVGSIPETEYLSLVGTIADEFTAHLVKAIQELNEKVEAQAAEIQVLKGGN